MSITSAIDEALEFIEAAGDPDIAEAQATQLTQLFANHPSCRKSDVTVAMKLLKGSRGRTAFPSSCHQALCRSLARVGSEIQIGVGGGSRRTIVVSPGQTHEYFEFYMTKKDWERQGQLRRGVIRVDIVIAMMVARAIAVKLFYPKVETIRAMIGIISAMHEVEPDVVELYKWYKDLKKMIVKERMRTGRSLAGPLTYPRDPAEFITSYPNCYSDDDPPADSEIDPMDAFNARSRTAARSTHSSVRDNPLRALPRVLVDPRTAHRDQSRNGNLPSDEDIKHLIRVYMQKVSTQRNNEIDVRLTEPIRRPQFTLGDIERSPSPSSSRGSIRNSSRGSPRGSPRDSPRGIVRWSSRESQLDSRDSPSDKATNPIGFAMERKEKAKKRTRLHEELAKLSSDDDSDESGIQGLLDKSAAVIACGKGKNGKKDTKGTVLAKKPAAKVLKKPSGNVCVELVKTPKMPPLDKTQPMLYKGAKIYTSPRCECWRVVPRPLQFHYDKKFPWGADPEDSWKLLVRYCERPIIPRDSPKIKK